MRPGWAEHPVSLVDLLPTVLDLCKIPVDATAVQGRSLAPGAAARPVSPVFVTRFIFPDDIDVDQADRLEALAVIAFPWKLIVTDQPPPGEPRVELYHLDEDPLEQHDRAVAEPQHVRRLYEVLQDFLRDQAGARARFVREHDSDVPGTTSLSRTPAREVLEQLRSLGYVR